MFEVWKLNRRIRRIEGSYAKDREELVNKKAPRVEFGKLEASEYYEVQELETEIDRIVSARLFREARRLDVETPPVTDKEAWRGDCDGRRVWLSPKGRAQVRKLIDGEKARRFDVKTRWVTRIILPVLVLLVGAIGTITGLVSVNLTRKQTEGVRAAIIEMPHGVSIDFPVPPSGEARTNVTNSGHVIAHDFHLSLSLTFKEVGRNDGERKMLSKSETIPAILPTAVTTRPDFIYPFELSRDEYRRVLDTTAYIVAVGGFDYENGFGKRVAPQQFCYAYVWGSNKFGRWTGSCDDVQLELRLAKEMSSK